MKSPRSCTKEAQGLEVRPGDVFRLSLKPNGRSITDNYWCFDGQLIATVRNGEIILRDTYWSFDDVHSSSGRTYTMGEAVAAGDLTFVVNLDELVSAQTHERRYYDEADLFDLSYQSRCYPKLMKRKGAKKSREAMYRALAQDRKEAEEALSSAIHKLEWIARTRQVVEDAADVEKVFP